MEKELERLDKGPFLLSLANLLICCLIILISLVNLEKLHWKQKSFSTVRQNKGPCNTEPKSETVSGHSCRREKWEKVTFAETSPFRLWSHGLFQLLWSRTPPPCPKYLSHHYLLLDGDYHLFSCASITTQPAALQPNFIKIDQWKKTQIINNIICLNEINIWTK